LKHRKNLNKKQNMPREIKFRQTHLRSISLNNASNYVGKYFGMFNISTKAMSNGTLAHKNIEEYILEKKCLPEFISTRLQALNKDFIENEDTFLGVEEYHKIFLFEETYEGELYKIYLTGSVDLNFNNDYIIDWKTQLNPTSTVTIASYLNSGQLEIYSLFYPKAKGGIYVKIYKDTVVDLGYKPFSESNRNAVKERMTDKAKLFFNSLKPFLF